MTYPLVTVSIYGKSVSTEVLKLYRNFLCGFSDSLILLRIGAFFIRVTYNKLLVCRSQAVM